MPPCRTRSSKQKHDLECPICCALIANASDMPRHVRGHDPDKEKYMIHCSYSSSGCDYKNMQKSNVKIHERKHTKNPFLCPDCTFTSYEPSTIQRHRQQAHGYQPRRTAPKDKKAAARRRRAQADRIRSLSAPSDNDTIDRPSTPLTSKLSSRSSTQFARSSLSPQSRFSSPSFLSSPIEESLELIPKLELSLPNSYLNSSPESSYDLMPGVIHGSLPLPYYQEASGPLQSSYHLEADASSQPPYHDVARSLQQFDPYGLLFPEGLPFDSAYGTDEQLPVSYDEMLSDLTVSLSVQPDHLQPSDFWGYDGPYDVSYSVNDWHGLEAASVADGTYTPGTDLFQYL